MLKLVLSQKGKENGSQLVQQAGQLIDTLSFDKVAIRELRFGNIPHIHFRLLVINLSLIVTLT